MKLNKKQRAELKQKYDGHCAYCGELLGDKWHADHIEPIERKSDLIKCQHTGIYKFKYTGEMKNPNNDYYENLNPSCISCNIHKSSKTVDEFRRSLEMHINNLNDGSGYGIYRHAKRFGLIIETQKPVTFYFETFKLQQEIEVYEE